MQAVPTIAWCWTHFYPGDSNYGDDHSHKEARCRHCVNRLVQELAEEDELNVMNGQIDVVRTPKELEIAALALTDAIAGKSERMRNHLKSATKCPTAPEEVRQIAARSVKSGGQRLSRKQTNARTAQESADARAAHFHPYAAAHQHSREIRRCASSEPPNHTSAPIPDRDPLGTMAADLTEGLSGLLDLWDKDSPEQREFEEDLCKVIVSCQWSWRCTDNGEFVRFLTKYVPRAKIPDRRVLSGRVLDSLFAKIEAGVKEKVGGKLGMGQCDAWKSLARASIVLSSVTVDATLYPLDAHDISAEAKTADNLLELTLSTIERGERELGLTFVGWCTDNGGDARGMRARMAKKKPQLILIPCFAHQVNLVVGEGLKLNLGCFKSIDKLVSIVKWYLNHSRALALLKDAQTTTEHYQKTKRILLPIFPVISRWIYHFLAARRILVLSAALRSLNLTQRENLIACAGSRSEARDAARAILAPIDSEEFWTNVTKTKIILEPLAIAAKCMQASDAGLDAVALMLGNLYRIYGSLDIPGRLRNKFRASLERRWAAIDREVAIVSLYTNPYVRGNAFLKTNLAVRPNSLYQMASRLVKRFLGVDPDLDFRAAFFDYDGGKREFSPSYMGLNEIKVLVMREKQRGLMLKVWGPLDTGELRGRNLLVKLAMWCHSVVANSAGSEQGFSRFGQYLTKLRSQMAVEKVRKMYAIDMELKRQHLELGLATERIQRRYKRFAEDHEQDRRAMEDYEAADTFEDLATQLIDDADRDDSEPVEFNDPEDDRSTGTDSDDDDGERPYAAEDLALARELRFWLAKMAWPCADWLFLAWLGFWLGIKAQARQAGLYCHSVGLASHSAAGGMC